MLTRELTPNNALQATATAPSALTGHENLNIIIASKPTFRWLCLSFGR